MSVGSVSMSATINLSSRSQRYPYGHGYEMNDLDSQPAEAAEAAGYDKLKESSRISCSYVVERLQVVYAL